MSTRPGITHEEHAAASRRRAEIQAAKDAVVDKARKWESSLQSCSACFDLCEALIALRKLEAGDDT